MKIDTKTIVSITEANRNFSKVTRLVDAYGAAVILKNNVPKYLVIDFDMIDQKGAIPPEILGNEESER